MSGRAIGLGVITVLAAPLVAGCSSQTCATRGCIASFTASVQGPGGGLPSGMHRIEILADLATLTCTFAFPLGTTAGGGAVGPDCQSGLEVHVGSPGETIVVHGTPGQVHAWQYVDDVTILDVAAAPTYQDVFPNGPECGGACRQASATWTLQ